MIDRTDGSQPTALDLLAGAGDVLRGHLDDDPTLLPELAFKLKDAGVLDGLDEHDARHAVAVTVVDLLEGGPEQLRARAAWIAQGGEGAAPLHDAAAVADALLATADVISG